MCHVYTGTAKSASDRAATVTHITQGVDGDELNTAHYRHHLALAEGAEATVIEHYVSLTAAKHFTGARLTMNVADNAQLRHIKLAFEMRPAITLRITIFCWRQTPRRLATVFCWAPQYYVTTAAHN